MVATNEFVLSDPHVKSEVHKMNKKNNQQFYLLIYYYFILLLFYYFIIYLIYLLILYKSVQHFLGFRQNFSQVQTPNQTNKDQSLFLIVYNFKPVFA